MFSALGILCLVSIGLIYKPWERDNNTPRQGLNDRMPQATTEQLTGNKLKAYELGAQTHQEETTREEMGRLSDYFLQNEPTVPQKPPSSVTTDKITNAMQQYEENTRLLDDFYKVNPYEQEQEAMKEEIASLKKQLSEKDHDSENEEDKQLALMEKSYQMAAKYLPSTSGIAQNTLVNTKEFPSIAEVKTPNNTNQEPVMEVLAENRKVVSSLDTAISDEDFIRAYGTQPRNLGFYSVASTTTATIRNTLKVEVDRTTTIKDGEYVVLRLLEPARIKELRLPRQSRLMAQAQIEGHRMKLLVKSIEIAGYIMPVHLSAYDTDGQEGIYIPGAEELSAIKEVGARIGGAMGTSFTFASSATDQMISEMTRGVMQGANQLLQKKLRTVKVTIKGGYQLFLVQTK